MMHKSLKKIYFRLSWQFFRCQCEVIIVFRVLFGLKLGNFYFGHIKLKFCGGKYFYVINSHFYTKQYNNINLTSNVMILGDF